jgi:hypothetical protein
MLVNKADERGSWEIPDASLEETGWSVVETSAKTGANVEEAFLRLTRAMLAERVEDE